MSFQILLVFDISCSLNEALNLAGSRCFAVDVERFETHRLTKLGLIGASIIEHRVEMREESMASKREKMKQSASKTSSRSGPTGTS